MIRLLPASLLLLLALSAQAAPPVFATPDQADMIRASRSLQDGFEKDAFDKFKRAARLGNKEAQKNLGLMYIKGMGVEKSWPRAHAWLRMAASRGDAQYRAAKDEVWGALRDDEKEMAEAYYQELREEYGDAAALERRERWVRRQKREVTGSRLGTIGALRVQVADATGYQWELAGNEFFEVLDTYVAELEPFVGEVEVGELEVIEDEN
ncbi:MAG: hypothetical protein AAGE01_08595 [Pseudomonadota bacterium]